MNFNNCTVSNSGSVRALYLPQVIITSRLSGPDFIMNQGIFDEVETLL